MNNQTYVSISASVFLLGCLLLLCTRYVQPRPPNFLRYSRLGATTAAFQGKIFVAGVCAWLGALLNTFWTIGIPASAEILKHPCSTQTIIQQGIINTSYEKLPFGSGDYPDKLLYHQVLN